jgi:chromosome segregation ATPase
MKDFRNVSLSDPRFIKLSQEQMKLKDDAKIVEDSLYSLAKRVFQIESFVTREVSAMKEHMDESSEGIKQRRLSLATGNQQLAMTSMNNLALLLNDVMKQLQDQMAQAMSGKKKQKGNQKMPGMSELQKQLNDKIQQLQQSGKSGRELSEELAKLAAEQEMLRRALKEMTKGEMKQNAKQGKEGDGGSLEEIIKKMEETEKELVNKNLNSQTINRQRDILTRLLDSEKAQKERDEEERREAEQAKDKIRTNPSQFADYIKVKEKQIELLKTIPPALSPYYRKQVDEYFKKIQ